MSQGREEGGEGVPREESAEVADRGTCGKEHDHFLILNMWVQRGGWCRLCW